MQTSDHTAQHQREQLLKLVAKAFFRELANYGVRPDEVLAVANHLLDSIVRSDGGPEQDGLRLQGDLTIGRVEDEWAAQRQVSLGDIALRPLAPENLQLVVEWLQQVDVRKSFVPALPKDRESIVEYFEHVERDYFGIWHEGRLVGVIGAEHIDEQHGKLEMKKLVGVDELRGRGIGTRATFAFLYHAFMIRGVHKVYIHSPDTNIRNLNLNSRLGFELEGIFLEEFKAGDRHVDVVRMALLKPMWLALFSD